MEGTTGGGGAAGFAGAATGRGGVTRGAPGVDTLFAETVDDAAIGSRAAAVGMTAASPAVPTEGGLTGVAGMSEAGVAGFASGGVEGDEAVGGGAGAGAAGAGIGFSTGLADTPSGVSTVFATIGAAGAGVVTVEAGRDAGGGVVTIEGIGDAGGGAGDCGVATAGAPAVASTVC